MGAKDTLVCGNWEKNMMKREAMYDIFKEHYFLGIGKK